MDAQLAKARDNEHLLLAALRMSDAEFSISPMKNWSWCRVLDIENGSLPKAQVPARALYVFHAEA